MKHPLCCTAVATALVTLFASCGKEEEHHVARQAESALPAEERMPAPAESAAAAPTEAPPPADPAVAEVPTELLASDKAYEAWFKKHGLDLNDPKMLDEDTDGDGASNRDEFMADTDPRDPAARPGIHKVMRLKQYNEVRLPLMLTAVEGGAAKIKRVEEGEEKIESVKQGGTIRGLKVERIVSRHDTDKTGERVDLSRVVLEDPATREKLVLVKDLPARTAATSAVLTSLDGATTLTIHEGDTFTWPEEQGSTYKVIDLRADQVVVQQLETKKMWTIPRAAN